MATQTIDIRVVDKTQKALGNIDKRLNNLEGSLLSVNKVAGLAATALGAIGGANIAKSIINTTARFQDLRTTLSSVTGSAKDGAAAFNFVSEFATKTQFGVEELSKAYISLKANGLEPTQQLLTLFTDTAAVTTDQIGTLEAMTKLFSRSAAGAGVQLEELDMVAERGVPVYKILEERLGLTRNEITEFGKTSEGTAVLIGALEEGLRDLAGGATAARLNNLSTQMSNVQINVANLSDAVGTGGLGPAFTNFVQLLNDALVRLKPLANLIGQELGFYVYQFTEFLKTSNFEFGKFLEGAKIGVAVLGGAGLLKVIKGVTTGIKGMTLALARNPFGLLAVAAASLITYLSMENGLGRTIKQVGAVIGKMGEAFAAVGRFLNEVFSDIINYIADLFYDFIDSVIAGYNALAEWVPFLDKTEATAREMADTVGKTATEAFQAVTMEIVETKDKLEEWVNTSELAKTATEEGAQILADLTKAYQDAGISYDEAEQKAREQYQALLDNNQALQDNNVQLGDVVNGTSQYTAETVQATQASNRLKEATEKLTDAFVENAEKFGGFGLVNQLNELQAAYQNALTKINENTEISALQRQEMLLSLEQQLQAGRIKIFEDSEKAMTDAFITQLTERYRKAGELNKVQLSEDEQATLQRIGRSEKYEEAIKKRIEFEKKSEYEKTQFAIEQAGDAFEALGRYNKKAFEASKALRIIETVMSTYQAATLALASYPPPFNFIAAAAVTAAGFANVAAIRSQQYQGRQRGGALGINQGAVVGEDGPELIVPKQPSTVIPREVAQAIEGMGGKGEPVIVNFNISTVDAQGFDELLISRRGTITGIINNAIQQKGRIGVV